MTRPPTGHLCRSFLKLGVRSRAQVRTILADIQPGDAWRRAGLARAYRAIALAS